VILVPVDIVTVIPGVILDKVSGIRWSDWFQPLLLNPITWEDVDVIDPFSFDEPDAISIQWWPV
jgi:hypothetical protein